MRRSSFRCVFVCSFLALAGCTDATYGLPDLPSDWAKAVRIDRFKQGDCTDAAVGGAPATIEPVVTDGSIDIPHLHADFRCQQDIEGYVREDSGTISVLVQPINLNPIFHSECNCQYDVAMTIPGDKRTHYASGSYQLSVYRRGDNIDKPNDPVAIGSVAVDVP
jgi:hypothetical protein